MDNYPQTTLKYFFFKFLRTWGSMCGGGESTKRTQIFSFFFKFFISTLNDAEVL